jgi:hypothetical protein
VRDTVLRVFNREDCERQVEGESNGHERAKIQTSYVTIFVRKLLFPASSASRVQATVLTSNGHP